MDPVPLTHLAMVVEHWETGWKPLGRPSQKELGRLADGRIEALLSMARQNVTSAGGTQLSAS